MNCDHCSYKAPISKDFDHCSRLAPIPSYAACYRPKNLLATARAEASLCLQLSASHGNS